MASARDIADYLLQLSSREAEPMLITQMHLHKLLYYVQGWSLAMRGEPMFPERIEAWTHGPVVQSLYPAYADYRNQLIEIPDRAVGLSADECAFVESVWEGHKGFSAAKLREMTHHETPWLLSRGDCAPDDRSDAEISPDEMLRFFQSQYDEQAIPGLERDVLGRAQEDFDSGRGVPLEEVFAG